MAGRCSAARWPAIVARLFSLALIAGACSSAADPGTPRSEPTVETVVETLQTTSPATTATDEYDLQGHRGARGLRPENTLPSFELALDELVDTLELDLHLTTDDVVVVWHDPVIDGAKCAVDGPVVISERTLAEVDELRCDRNPDPDRFPDQVATAGAVAGDDYTIVALAEVFRFVAAYATSAEKTEAQRANAATVRFNVETKRKPSDPAAIGDGFDGRTIGRFERQLIATAAEAGMLARTTVQSFDHRSLWTIHDAHPDVPLAALTTRTDVPDFVDLAERGATTWSPDHRALTAEDLAAAHDAGLLVVPWTVNEPERMAELLALGVDGLITDRPDLAPRS